MATRPLLGLPKALDADGRPISGAKVYFTASGTDTPQDTFTDAGLTTPHPHPIESLANGEWPEIFLGPGDYRVRITDANDVALGVGQYDPVSGASSALPIEGGALTGFLTLHADPVQLEHAATKAYVDRVILEELDVTGAAEVVFTDLITDDYDVYILDMLGVQPASDNVTLRVQWSADNGTSWITSDYSQLQILQTDATPAATGTFASSQAANNIAPSMGNAANEIGSFQYVIYRHPTLRGSVWWEGTYLDQAPQLAHIRGGTQFGVPIDAVRVQFSSGNIATGRFRLSARAR